MGGGGCGKNLSGLVVPPFVCTMQTPLDVWEQDSEPGKNIEPHEKLKT